MTDLPPRPEDGTGDPPGLIPEDLLAEVRQHRRRFTVLGMVLVAMGVLAIVFPLVASIAAKLMIGWLLLVAGAAVLYHAFQARNWRSALWSGAIGLLYLVAGAYLAFLPLSGLVGLTVLLGALFLLQGIMEMAIALQHGDERGRGWLIASGLASLVLGVLLVAGLPGTALWALGLLLGINLLSSGIAFVALARGV